MGVWWKWGIILTIKFKFSIKKKINIDSTQSIFLICNNILINNSQIMNQVYNRYHEADGFLYMILTLENVFGNDLK